MVPWLGYVTFSHSFRYIAYTDKESERRWRETCAGIKSVSSAPRYSDDQWYNGGGDLKKYSRHFQAGDDNQHPRVVCKQRHLLHRDGSDTGRYRCHWILRSLLQSQVHTVPGQRTASCHFAIVVDRTCYRKVSKIRSVAGAEVILKIRRKICRHASDMISVYENTRSRTAVSILLPGK